MQKNTSPSKVMTKLEEWMDTFQMNPKTMCADMAFHQPHDMQACYRMHNVKRLRTGPHTPRPNRVEIGLRLFKTFLLALVDTASKNLDQTTLAQITPAELMRKAATVRNTQVTLSGKTPMELGVGRRPRDLLDPASMNPEQLTSTPTLDEEIQKLALRTHIEVQQRADIRRDLAERMKFVPLDLQTRENVSVLARRSERNPARTEIWQMVEGGNHCCQGLMAVVNTGATIFQANVSKLRRPVHTGFGKTSGLA